MIEGLIMYDNRGAVIKRGVTVQWKSQAQGSWRVKRGEVVAIIPAHTRADRYARFGPGDRRRYDADINAVAVRVLVRVPRLHKRSRKLLGWDWYCPYAGVVTVMDGADGLWSGATAGTEEVAK
ncbi:MAG: hypothetical protein K6T83_07910 [Alicyclobacillus sp.]|nr:hypothetical protein [Alicyclobacillus sp.]